MARELTRVRDRRDARPVPQHTEELFNKQAIAMFCELHKRMLNTLCEAELKDSTHQVVQDLSLIHI